MFKLKISKLNPLSKGFAVNLCGFGGIKSSVKMILKSLNLFLALRIFLFIIIVPYSPSGNRVVIDDWNHGSREKLDKKLNEDLDHLLYNPKIKPQKPELV